MPIIALLKHHLGCKDACTWEHGSGPLGTMVEHRCNGQLVGGIFDLGAPLSKAIGPLLGMVEEINAQHRLPAQMS